MHRMPLWKFILGVQGWKQSSSSKRLASNLVWNRRMQLRFSEGNLCADTEVFPEEHDFISLLEDLWNIKASTKNAVDRSIQLRYFTD